MSDLTIYTVGWICAIGTELVAAIAFLDERHGDPEQLPSGDDNTYVLGRIGKHNVVIAALPLGQYGLVSSAIVARDMAHSFPNVRFGLMVGIGGGAPSSKHDIRLGDIVVSSPDSGTGGVLQYDFGKTIQDESFAITGHLNQSPQCLLRAIPVLEAEYESDGHAINAEIDRILESKPRLRAKYRKPDPSTDKLFSSAYKHVGTKEQECGAVCVDASQLVVRAERSEEQDSPLIHFGLIASANQLMKDANMRDRLSAEKDVLCFEMEAAGLMNHFPCLIIRGICDYSDTHKNKAWQGYAAMAAAAYTKDLLRKVAPSKVEAERKLVDVIESVNEKLDEIFPVVSETHTTIQAIHTNKHFDNVIRWLNPPDVSSNLNKALEARYTGSGRRLIEGEAYQKWKTQPKSFLWLYGIPGCGKTILASTVIEDLQNSPDCSPTLLYFYFDFTDNQKQTFESTLRSILSQLYYKTENTRKGLNSLYSSCKNGMNHPDVGSLQQAFNNMAQQAGEVWLVLDALDECISRPKLLSWLQFLHTSEMNVHILATSRPEYDIESAIRRFCSDEEAIAIQGDLIDGDIRAYVHAQVREHENFRIWETRPDIQQEIKTSLLEKAKGMFRWVWCQLDALKQCRDPRALRKVLKSLPRTLDETYERILSNIPSEYADHTMRILQFLTYSERPLRIDEAVDAIAVDVGIDVARGSRFNPQDRMPIPTEIIGYCSSLVVLVRRVYSYDESIVEEIQLAHFSVKDYLTSDRLKGEPSRYLQESSARSSIAEVCLAYLLEPKPQKIREEVRKAFPFSQFSAQYWASHAVIGERDNHHVFMLAKELFLSQSLIESWLRLYDPDRSWDPTPVTEHAGPSLYYASLLGLSLCVGMLLENGADVNAQGRYYCSTLQAASSGGHEKVVQLLLEKGADVNAQVGDYGSALQAASDGGHKKVVQLLLEKGADVNAQGGRCGSALQAASFGGHEKLVQLLLEKGADVNTQVGCYGTALRAASSRGHEMVVLLLLEKGADVNAQGGRYGSALQAASYGGHEKLVQVLLDKGADVNAQSGRYGTALQAASYGGHEKVVQLLLENDADVNAQGGRYGSALQAASYGGHEKLVQVLLENGADVNAQGGRYSTALQAASYEGYEKVVHLLLEKGADVNAQGGYYGSALQAASNRGHEKVVHLLLEKSADVNTQVGYYGSALQAASSRGHEMVVLLLLENGADFNAQGGYYGSALQAASYGGHEKLVQVLLDKGADVNAQGGDYGTALQAASYGGHEKVVHLLLENGADVNAQGGRFDSSLQAASDRQHEKVVQLLLDNGANWELRIQ